MLQYRHYVSKQCKVTHAMLSDVFDLTAHHSAYEAEVCCTLHSRRLPNMLRTNFWNCSLTGHTRRPALRRRWIATTIGEAPGSSKWSGISFRLDDCKKWTLDRLKTDTASPRLGSCGLQKSCDQFATNMEWIWYSHSNHGLLDI